MDIGRYVAQLRDDLAAAAAPGDEQTQRTAALLGAAVEPAARLALMNALADLAAEITTALAGHRLRRHQPDHATPGRADQGPGRAGRRGAGRIAELLGGPGRAGCTVRPGPSPTPARTVGGRHRRRRPVERPGRRPPPARVGAGMTEAPDELPGGLVRQENRPVGGPIALDLAVDVGRVLVLLDPGADPDASDASEVRLEVRHDPAAGGGWAQRIGEVASWLGTVGAG